MEYFRKDGRIITYGLSSLVKSIAPIGMPYQRKGNGRDYLGAIHACDHAGSVRVVARLPDRASSLCSRGLSAVIPRTAWHKPMFPQESSCSATDDSLKGNVDYTHRFRGYRYAQPTATQGFFPAGKQRTIHSIHLEAADGPRGLTPNYTVACYPMPLCIPDKNELRGRRVRRGSR